MLNYIDSLFNFRIIADFFMMGIELLRFCFSKKHRTSKLMEWKDTSIFFIMIEIIISLFSLLLTTSITILIIAIGFSIIF